MEYGSSLWPFGAWLSHNDHFLKSLSLYYSRESDPQAYPTSWKPVLSHITQARKESTNSSELTVLLVVPETGQNPAHSFLLAVSLVKIRFTNTHRTDKLRKKPFYKLRFLICYLRYFQQTLFPKTAKEMLSKHPVVIVLLRQCWEGKGSVFYSIVMSKEELQQHIPAERLSCFTRVWKLTCNWY